MVKRVSWLLLLFFSAAFAQNASVSVKSDSTRYRIGDYININLSYTLPGRAIGLLPPPGELLQPLEFVKEVKRDTSRGSAGTTVHVQMIYSAYDSGRKTTRPVEISYRIPGDSAAHTLTSDSLRLFIQTVAVDTALDIRDLKPPVEEPLDWLFILLVAGAIALAVSAIVYYLKKRKKTVTDGVQEEEALPPYELAMRELDILEKKQLWQQGLVKEYHSEITGIVRMFFERYIGFPALEQTSRETITELEQHLSDREIISATEEFLSNADMVKFAKFVPIPQINSEMMRQARLILNLARGRSTQRGGE